MLLVLKELTLCIGMFIITTILTFIQEPHIYNYQENSFKHFRRITMRSLYIKDKYLTFRDGLLFKDILS